MDEIQLSVVATSRNDNHGGQLTGRMQHFADGFIAQCKRHGLRAELILVDWNPPADRVPLLEELGWPAEGGPCEVRVITVAPELHAQLAHADKIPLFQMIAKNIGIRRARGRFVLATNIDILFSDRAIRYMRDRLQPGRLYRTDRVDIPAALPQSADFADVLSFCDTHGFRIHGHACTVVRSGERWRRLDLLKVALPPRLAYAIHLAEQLCSLAMRAFAKPEKAVARLALGDGKSDWPVEMTYGRRNALALVLAFFHHLPARLARVARLTASKYLPTLYKRMLRPWPFTNACGDFTLLAREDWFRLRGYAEWPIFSWHLDSLLIHQALAAGLRETHLGGRAPVFHIEHGKGYTPEGAGELFLRLQGQGIPFLSDEDFTKLDAKIARGAREGTPVEFNPGSWGLADLALPEASPWKNS